MVIPIYQSNASSSERRPRDNKPKAEMLRVLVTLIEIIWLFCQVTANF